jgi:hypothetical protein
MATADELRRPGDQEDEEELVFPVFNPPWVMEHDTDAELELAAATSAPADARPRAKVVRVRGADLSIIVKPSGHLVLVLERTTEQSGAIADADIRLERVTVAGRVAGLARGRTDARGHVILGRAEDFARPGENEYYRVRVVLPRTREGEEP